MPEDVWPNSTYPTWYQGLVYFLSPSLTGDLFKTATNTPYMFTDDVYMGVLVNKLNKTRNIVTMDLKYLSDDYHALENWRTGPHVFFHAPNVTAYWEMLLDNDAELLSETIME